MHTLVKKALRSAKVLLRPGKTTAALMGMHVLVMPRLIMIRMNGSMCQKVLAKKSLVVLSKVLQPAKKANQPVNRLTYFERCLIIRFNRF